MIAAVAAFLLMAAVGIRAARAQFFSPGPLARGHAHLEGVDQCGTCHGEQRRLSPKTCLACHTELAPSLAAGTGLHGRMPADKRSDCQSCHPDHRGRDFPLIRWDGGRQTFDHRQVGWPLQGAHAAQKCAACHDSRHRTAAAFLSSAPRLSSTRTSPPSRPDTFLGLNTACASCHFDEHRGQLGQACRDCHTAEAWKPAPFFSHESAKFRLRGKHKTLACAGCHPTVRDDDEAAAVAGAAPPFPRPRSPEFEQLIPVEHRSCASCHRDPHQGQLGSTCANCHAEAGWRLVLPHGKIDTEFHDRTRYPLLGAHVGVPCRDCHGPQPGRPARFKGLAFGKCGDCHQDGHGGQLAVRPGDPGPAPDCAACHSVEGFTPARFDSVQHGRTRFPLEGAHQAVACSSCHPSDMRLVRQQQAMPRGRVATASASSATGRPIFAAAVVRPSPMVLRPPREPASCSGCHVDPHRRQFAARMKRDDCGGCHSSRSFLEVSFDHQKDSRFPLTGAHQRAACASCHRPDPGKTGVVRYRPLPVDCAGCHSDQHQGQFQAPSGALAPAPAPAAAATAAAVATTTRAIASPAVPPASPALCSHCHTTNAFKPALFDHGDAAFTSFSLNGKHAALACSACHRPTAVAPGVETVRYRPLPRTCEGCHSDFHRGEFGAFRR